MNRASAPDVLTSQLNLDRRSHLLFVRAAKGDGHRRVATRSAASKPLAARRTLHRGFCREPGSPFLPIDPTGIVSTPRQDRQRRPFCTPLFHPTYFRTLIARNLNSRRNSAAEGHPNHLQFVSGEPKCRALNTTRETILADDLPENRAYRD